MTQRTKQIKAKRLRTNTKEYDERMYKYIMDSIDFDHLPTDTDKEKMHSLLSEFERVANYPYNFQRLPNIQERLADYLQGLPIGLEYDNYNILELAKKLHDVKELTEAQEDNILASYWMHIAFKILSINNKLEACKLSNNYILTSK